MSKISTFHIKNEQLSDDKIKIIGDDVKHIKNVLRYKIGDEIEICTESEKRYLGKISKMNNDEITVNISEELGYTTELPVKVTLFQGLPKSDKMDLIIQKCTELGIYEIVPIITKHVVVKIDENNGKKKVERWKKISAEAAKQSGRQKIPEIRNIINLENIVENLSKYDIVIVPYECEKENTLKAILKKYDKEIRNIAVVIGPEGGFAEEDINILEEKVSKIEKVSLGKRILRTETAGIATMAMILYEIEL